MEVVAEGVEVGNVKRIDSPMRFLVSSINCISPLK